MRLEPLEAIKQNPKHHPEGDALYHSLQVFELAREARPYDEEFLLAALLHDVGKAIDPQDHAAAAAFALRGTLTERTAWLIAHHRDLPGQRERAPAPAAADAEPPNTSTTSSSSATSTTPAASPGPLSARSTSASTTSAAWSRKSTSPRKSFSTLGCYSSIGLGFETSEAALLGAI